MTASTARFRYIGTTDDTTTCENCGKVELRSTVIIVPLDADGSDDGEPCYYGSTCAARALAIPGGGAAVRKAANGARLETLMAAHEALRMLNHYGLPAQGEPAVDEFEAAVSRYADQHSGARWAPLLAWSDWEARTSDMLSRKQAAIREAVLVAGAEWAADRQPLEYGYRSAIAATFAG